MLLVVFLLANAMVSGILTNYLTKENERQIKESLGAVVYMTGTFDNIEEYMGMTLYNAMKDYYNKSQVLNEEESVVVSNYALFTSNYYSQSVCNVSDWSPLMYGDANEEQYRNVLLYGSDLKEPYDFVARDIELVSGRVFTQEEIEQGKAVVVVDENMYVLDENKWRKVHVGDCIPYEIMVFENDYPSFDKVVYKETRELEVIGVYRCGNRVTVIDNYQKASIYENRFYVPNSLIKQLAYYQQDLYDAYSDNEADTYAMNDVRLDKVSFLLRSVDDVEEFQEGCNAFIKEYNRFGMVVEANTDAYASIAPSMVLLQRMSTLCYVVSSVIAVVILGIMMLIAVRNRTYELGVLMAIGAKRWQLVLQIVVESMVVVLTGLTLSIPSSIYITKVMFTMIATEEVLMILPLESFGYAYISMILVVLVSVLFSLIYIIRLNPKKILLMS